MKQQPTQIKQSSLINPGEIWIGRFSSHEVEIVSLKPSSEELENKVTYIDEADNLWTKDLLTFQKRFQLAHN